MRSSHCMRKDGVSSMTPLLVMLGAVVIIVAGFVLSQFFYLDEGDRQDNGEFLDEEISERGQPYAYLQIERYGTIKIFLDEAKAPITVANWISLNNRQFYNGLTFHRVIQDFMIQGGDPSGDGTGGPGYTIESEADNGLQHDRGAIAMAKKGDDVRMSGSQFYIVQGANGAHHLDGQHTVFGNVVEGMEIVDQIASASTNANDAPLTPIIIERAYIQYE
ncbi:MAG: peptidylprolyl isomerase [Thermoplasmatota archaeon]